MIGLGIESTAHTLGIGIVKNGKIIANEKNSYITNEGGIIPMDAAKHHEDVFDKVLERVLEKTKVQLGNLDFIAVSIGPGLAPCLLIGLKKAKQLCKKLNKPLVPVNHCIAHLEIGKMTGAKDAVMLYASGANTQVIAYEAGKYRVFGETLDIGVGNFIDNFARYAGIGFPGGPVIEKLALKSKKNYIELPYKVKGMDIALSGILTNLKQKLEAKYNLNDLAYSLQETVFAMLVETAERALAHTGKKELLLGGGVACNSRLQEMCKIMCKERGAKFFCPERSLLVDNAAMIAFLGEIMFRKGIKESDLSKIDILPRQRTDDVEVTWK
ncbi:N(6)-L-threonylcarbamoyladenine synthase Kae1 [Candidatus Pacearchaeota archaeon]|nr:N(6)-L-threonylcarbamoyladenine synthase Kae1 [Candidatus Pacearchaeota archaeon]